MLKRCVRCDELFHQMKTDQRICGACRFGRQPRLDPSYVRPDLGVVMPVSSSDVATRSQPMTRTSPR